MNLNPLFKSVRGGDAGERLARSLPGNFVRRAGMLTTAISALLLGGCVQMSLDDLGEPARAIPTTLSSDMRAKGMNEDGQLLIRIFKMESELEVWKMDAAGRYVLLKTYPICRWSGKLGPKKKSGDRQAPEGFYRVSRGMLNPKSEFFLSFNLGYPNRLEAALGYSGEALMVHGACSSSGCFALTDQGVGEIYALLEKSLSAGQAAVQVQSFPFRMSPKNLAEHRDDPNMAFWRDLKKGYDIFEVTRREPKVSMCGGRYLFDATFSGSEPSSPLKACPARTDTVNSLVAAREMQDDRMLEKLSASARIAKPYDDGGMHVTFRALLRKNGDRKLAAKVSQIDYPVSRPSAALADPYKP